MPAELKVMSARAVNAAVSVLSQGFIRATGIMVVFDFAPVGTLEQKLAGGEMPDALILSAAAIDKLERAGRLVAGSRRDLGRTSIGVAVRSGAARPDISTPEAFKAMLLAAHSIALSDAAVGGTAALYLPQLFERLGIAEALEPKLMRRSGGGDVAHCVASGDAEIGLTFISEIIPIRGASVVGPLPEVYGNDTVYCAAVPSASRDRATALTFIKTLTEPTTVNIWAAAGFKSVSR